MQKEKCSWDKFHGKNLLGRICYQNTMIFQDLTAHIVVPRPTVSISPRNFSEMQNLRPYPRPAISESSSRIARWLACTWNFWSTDLDFPHKDWDAFEHSSIQSKSGKKVKHNKFLNGKPSILRNLSYGTLRIKYIMTQWKVFSMSFFTFGAKCCCKQNFVMSYKLLVVKAEGVVPKPQWRQF